MLEPIPIVIDFWQGTLPSMHQPVCLFDISAYLQQPFGAWQLTVWPGPAAPHLPILHHAAACLPEQKRVQQQLQALFPVHPADVQQWSADWD